MSVLWCVELDLFSLKCLEVSSSEFLGVYGFGMALGSPSCNVQGCVPVCWRISVVCLALELVGSWVELGFSVVMEILGSSCLLMFPGIRSSLVFSSFGFKPPASGFQSYSYSSLKTSPSIQHR